jgi:hypothetical protein
MESGFMNNVIFMLAMYIVFEIYTTYLHKINFLRA